MSGTYKNLILISFLMGPVFSSFAKADILPSPTQVKSKKAAPLSAMQKSPAPANTNAVKAAEPIKAAPAKTQFASEAVERGKKIFRINCLQCHNADPRKPGSQGPAVYGSSLELLQARILKRGYPEGYKPQRTTKIMPALPFLEKEIPNLHAYLNSPL